MVLKSKPLAMFTFKGALIKFSDSGEYETDDKELIALLLSNGEVEEGTNTKQKPKKPAE